MIQESHPLITGYRILAPYIISTVRFTINAVLATHVFALVLPLMLHSLLFFFFLKPLKYCQIYLDIMT